MGAWPGKFVIGLTGNIATGKSVVRKMLEHLGAYGIDADALAHRAIAKGAPGYGPVVDTFGSWIVDSAGQIDRAKLGRVVFSDPEALKRLEAIVHPLVGQAVDILIRRSKQRVIVVEAIKLIESSLASKCDSLWTTYAPQEIQEARLIQKRGMSKATAHQRITAQPAQEEKVGASNVVIRNSGTFEDTWNQVAQAWDAIFPEMQAELAPRVPKDKKIRGELNVQRARPSQAKDIANLINRLSAGSKELSRADIMAAFGEKAFLLLTMDDKPVGIAGWQVENLVARTDEVYLEAGLPISAALRSLMDEVERASKELQCEVSLLFLPAEIAKKDSLIRDLGYQVRTVKSLMVDAWQEAARESMPPGTVMLFKQLRQDRVLRPV